MFEAKILEGNILKKIVDAIKDVVNDVNIDVSPSGKLTHPKIQLTVQTRLSCLCLTLTAKLRAIQVKSR